MHVRFSTCRGLAVTEEGADDALGYVSGVFIHPDLGRVEGVFVQRRHFLLHETLFLSSADILHWGTHIEVRDAEMLSPLEERVRLQSIWDEGRTVLGQRMLTETGKILGRCRDVQFDTKTFQLEWLFPRRTLRWGIAQPASAIVEVRGDAIILKDTTAAVEVGAQPVFKALDELTKQSPTVSGCESH